ncbi:hypothetical protein FORC89_p136 (plasmid) [Salmonella sp. FORC89]|uniref:Uncharacterized protein n=1 Tax=Salmonella enteritidis (strain 2009K0958) TaxID=1192586 RepID=A0A656IBQ0_SALE2|nr:hypothetical protein FORC51_p0072 [Salmonella enterica]EPI62519.1 hypothetical protein A673_05103 [Salmonella enterica subsp. enterica serovar Enteritidis str. 2009K0958]EPI80040.1 hypothetical protein A675_04281 [Salmonella enterica subsp. enterica serovar Enteritidis str. 2009K1726]EPI80174.1 hypothetical protein A676_04051 [Salmonella enterica subsp. enterica serovar Enteritidis str. 2010K-0262]EPI93823.1 hypothetical protein A678_04623 [Salmonella enterica subsp. enterica serovar Enterit
MLFSELLKCYYPTSMDVIGLYPSMEIRNEKALFLFTYKE